MRADGWEWVGPLMSAVGAGGLGALIAIMVYSVWPRVTGCTIRDLARVARRQTVKHRLSESTFVFTKPKEVPHEPGIQVTTDHRVATISASVLGGASGFVGPARRAAHFVRFPNGLLTAGVDGPGVEGRRDAPRTPDGGL